MDVFRTADATAVRRLRITPGGVDPFAARLRAAQLLGAASLRPPALPGAAILCVRRLRDPLPGALSLRSGTLRPPAVWEQAVATSLDEATRRAVRPALGPVGANADAVLFRDRAELLACLAMDWCRGDALTRWWWRGLLRGGDGASAVRAAWLDGVDYVPAALAYLARAGLGAAFARVLGPTAVHDLLCRILERFALAHLRAALMLGGVVATAEGATFATAASRHPRTPGVPPEAAALAPAAPPWLQWIPEPDIVALPAALQCGVAVGLMLERAPEVVRAPSFARDVHDWCARVVPSDECIGAAEPATVGAVRDGVDRAAASRPHPVVGDAPPVSRADRPACPADVGAAFAASSPEHSVATGYGGVLYLINVALALQLYGDFTMPAHLGIALSVWDFLALIGRELVGASIADDPLWLLLAALAGRVDAEPGDAFEPPDEWRIPADWLRPFSSTGVWRWSAQGGRLRVAHPAQFLVTDVIARDDPVEQAGREVARYQPVDGALRRTATIADGPDRSLERWLAWLIPYLRARLARGLNAPDAGGLGDVGSTVCRHSARIVITPARLDATFAIDALPVAIRLAGLDRDPGWVPAAGRSIAFHYA